MLRNDVHCGRVPTLVDVHQLPEGFEQALHEHVFSRWDQEFLQTPAGLQGVQEVLVNRLYNALRFSVPWLQRQIELSMSRIIEVGCGSGSSTAALAMYAREVVGFDIDELAVKAAQARCQAYGLQNVRVHCTEPERLLDAIRDADQADAYVLYAVLEHMTYAERLTTLRTLWDLLAPGRFLVIFETPNRLAYLDQHTTDTAFFHLLPDELAFRYVDRIKRHGFRDSMKLTLEQHLDVAALQRIRWGLGASFHEFEIALEEPLEELVLADGFEQEMTDFFPGGLDEELLTRFFLAQVVDQPIGFARCVLSLILRKPASTAHRREAADRNWARRQEIAARLQPASAAEARQPTHPPADAVAFPPAPPPFIRRLTERLLIRLSSLRSRLAYVIGRPETPSGQPRRDLDERRRL